MGLGLNRDSAGFEAAVRRFGFGEVEPTTRRFGAFFRLSCDGVGCEGDVLDVASQSLCRSGTG